MIQLKRTMNSEISHCHTNGIKTNLWCFALYLQLESSSRFIVIVWNKATFTFFKIFLFMFHRTKNGIQGLTE